MINQTSLVAMTVAIGVLLTGAVASDVHALGTDTVVESFEQNMGPWTACGSIACFELRCPLFSWQTARITNDAHSIGFTTFEIQRMATNNVFPAR